jgi:dienelactone hydrolase
MVDADMNAVFTSPDAQRYAILVIRGDIANDGLWAELRVGRLDSFERAELRTVTRLFTNGLGSREGFGQVMGSPVLTQPWANVPKWLDNRSVGLLWQDASGTIQVLRVDVSNGASEFLTQSATDVTAFTSSGNALLYDALIAHNDARSRKMLHEGFTVTGADVVPYLSGIVDGTSASDYGMCERFVVPRAGGEPRRPGDGLPTYCGTSFVARFPSGIVSPDGKWAIVDSIVSDDVPLSWSSYRNADLSRLLRHRAVNAKSASASALNRLILLNLLNGSVRPLWDAPQVATSATHIQWSPDSSRVLLFPTFTPVAGAGKSGLAGNSIAEVKIAAPKYSLIELDDDLVSRVENAHWLSNNEVELLLPGTGYVRYRRSGDSWRSVTTQTRNSSVQRRHESTPQRLRVALRQDLRNPPMLYIVDGTRERLLLDLNPQLRTLSLGDVSMIDWVDADGVAWRGRLYLPVAYDSGYPYPLIIQTHGYAPEDEFSLYGPGHGAPALGPGWSVYLAQVLANRGFVVLQMGDPATEALRGGVSELERGRAGIESVIVELSGRGLVDSSRVGLMGHSGTGRLVEHTITHSMMRFAAAIAADYADTNYLQAALYGWPQFSADMNEGAAPFGAGLETWLRTAPAFNVERITTPLQLQVTSSSRGFAALLWNWEIFSRLRHQRKPVEFFVVPDVEHGSHILQNPRQLSVLQQRALDWWCFWLKDEESADPTKGGQYREWRQLRTLRNQDEALLPSAQLGQH